MKRTVLILSFLFSCIICAESSAAPVTLEGNLCDVTGIETAGGRLFLAVVSGSYADRTEVNLIASANGGKSFTAPLLTISHESLSVADAVLWADISGNLWMFYTESDGRFDGRGALKAIRCQDPSSDPMKWSEPMELGYGICTGKPVEMSGRIVLPFALWSRSEISDYPHIYGNLCKEPRTDAHSDLDTYRGAGIYVSEDGGRSWKCSPRVVQVPAKVDARCTDPSLMSGQDGSLMMLLRSNGTGYAYMARSSDAGLTWNSPEPFIIHPDRKMALETIQDGTMLMVRHNALDQYSLSRTSGLYAYMSDDCGRTWYGNLVLSTDDHATGAVTEATPDGKCWVAYTAYEKGRRTLFLSSVGKEDMTKSVSSPLKHKSVAAAVAQESDIPSKKGSRKWCPEPLKVGTYNIQVSRAVNWDPRADWNLRLPVVTTLIDEYDFDILCSQEPYRGQMDDLISYYKDKYDWVGRTTAADSLATMSSYNPIFYRKERLELLDWGIEWLTAVPGTPGYDAVTPRNMTWAHLRDKASGKEFYCFSCHYDHKGVEARSIASYILLDAIKRRTGDLPVICCGDFNSLDFSDPYNVLVNSGVLADSYTTCAEPVNGEYTSCPSYKPKAEIPKNRKHIDHVFYTPDNSVILSWELIIEDYNGIYGSDHLPICVEWKFSN